ncbi:hypothetical protein SETIT_9G266500v2 [Setaria italica]|uniref:Uncharacterized protein n=1 Tax=Setaria italica TaxID=4555 RepID=A0A368SL08_SETIT|nr:hypothetical protein SETIT_9G266500v2 [Setaria italica]
MAMVPVATLILALLACTKVAAGFCLACPHAEGPTICDTAKCGKGTCREMPGPIPLLTTSYNCTCDPGWTQPKLIGLIIPSAPCIIPDCK